MDSMTDLAPVDETELAAILRDRCAARDPVWIKGGGTRVALRRLSVSRSRSRALWIVGCSENAMNCVP